MNNEKINQIIDEAHRNYCANAYKEEYNRLSQNGLFEIDLEWVGFTQEEFINKCKTDPEFSERWGLKIEERELSLEERHDIKEQYGFDCRKLAKPSIKKLDDANIPTKQITITYNNEKIESYEY